MQNIGKLKNEHYNCSNGVVAIGDSDAIAQGSKVE